MRILCTCIPVAALVSGCVSVSVNQTGERGITAAAAISDAESWKTAENGILANHVQLTFPDRFVKAGEAYFSPDDQQIIFQAIEVEPDGGVPAEFYSMFVADIARDANGRVRGLDDMRRISPPGSANTCGWFHPTETGVVLFATTLVAPTASHPPGYQRASGRYRWMFPPEMSIVRCTLDDADGTIASLEPVVGGPDAYVAEGAVSPDGRHLVFCSLEYNGGDLLVMNLVSGSVTRLIQASGYDGGPFFSPDGKRLCYRSDRRGDHHLQLFVAELAFNESGEIVGVEREHQLTNNNHVNWCPFWHPGGRHLIYATSEMGHHNYEVYLVDADDGHESGSAKYGVGARRLTHAEGPDVLPAFNSDGSVMMWTSRRSDDGSVQLWLADFVLELEK